jgi:hypothetical protein
MWESNRNYGLSRTLHAFTVGTHGPGQLTDSLFHVSNVHALGVASTHLSLSAISHFLDISNNRRR